MDYQTVRFDPTYIEPMDPEIIPLCDELNAAGFFTTCSCCGHGGDHPRVWFEHSADERIEHFARAIMAQTDRDYSPFCTIWRKEIRPLGYSWSVEIHLNNIYSDTSIADGLAMAVSAMGTVSQLVRVYNAGMNIKTPDSLDELHANGFFIEDAVSGGAER